MDMSVALHNPTDTAKSYKYWSEWRSDGIAYGQDLATSPQNNFWGVVNQENRESVVRVGDNTITPGMKFWEWGQNGSFDTNIFRRGSSERPYIELWAGTSDRFFSPAVLQPHQTGSWTESLAPALGLADVTQRHRRRRRARRVRPRRRRCVGHGQRVHNPHRPGRDGRPGRRLDRKHADECDSRVTRTSRTHSRHLSSPVRPRRSCSPMVAGRSYCARARPTSEPNQRTSAPVTGAAPHARPRGPERHERTPCSTEKEAQ